MINFQLTLESEAILLRPLEKSDIQQFRILTRDSSLWVYFTSDLSDEWELESWVNDGLLQIKNKARLAFCIIDKSNNQVIGSTSFGNISTRDKRIEIGWTWLCKDAQGKGLNNKIKCLMLKHCFEFNDFDRVEFKTDVLHKAARKALTKIGMIEEGILRNHTQMTNGRKRDTIFYSILKSEWNEVKAKNKWV